MAFPMGLFAVPAARRGSDGAEYIHIPVQKDSAGG